MPPFQFDPREMILGPYTVCSACGEDALGTESIDRNQLVRRCRNCLGGASVERLPLLHKKIVYLDQMVLSNLAKAIDPVWKREKRQLDPFWLDMFDALDRALKLQLVVFPESRIHQQESVVYQHFSALRGLYEHFASGTDFEFPSIVHRKQLIHAFRQVLRRVPVEYESLPRSLFVEGDVDGWMNRIRLAVRWAAAEPDPVVTERVSRNSRVAFQTTFAGWAAAKKTFEQVYSFERRGLADATVELTREHERTIERWEQGDDTAGDNLVNMRMEVDTVLQLIRLAQIEGGLEEQEAQHATWTFLYSDEAMNAPANDISALLMAALSRRAASGQKGGRLGGMWNDFTAIASYLPYCDAMFIDNECASLLAEGPLTQRITYATKIFSTRSREEFLKYLRALENDAGTEHVERVSRVYGVEWLTPYRTILEKQRNKDARPRDDD